MHEGAGMKIKDVQPVRAEAVTTDEDFGDCMRYGADNWMRRYGESWEPEFDCAELERAYRRQKFKRAKGR